MNMYYQIYIFFLLSCIDKIYMKNLKEKKEELKEKLIF